MYNKYISLADDFNAKEILEREHNDEIRILKVSNSLQQLKFIPVSRTLEKHNYILGKILGTVTERERANLDVSTLLFSFPF